VHFDININHTESTIKQLILTKNWLDDFWALFCGLRAIFSQKTSGRPALLATAFSKNKSVLIFLHGAIHSGLALHYDAVG
jgi:hypothetical protein